MKLSFLLILMISNSQISNSQILKIHKRIDTQKFLVHLFPFTDHATSSLLLLSSLYYTFIIALSIFQCINYSPSLEARGYCALLPDDAQLSIPNAPTLLTSPAR